MSVVELFIAFFRMIINRSSRFIIASIVRHRPISLRSKMHLDVSPRLFAVDFSSFCTNWQPAAMITEHIGGHRTTVACSTRTMMMTIPCKYVTQNKYISIKCAGKKVSLKYLTQKQRRIDNRIQLVQHVDDDDY